MPAASESVWEADDTEPVLDTTVASILRDAARRSPDTIALVAGTADPAARRRWTYAELLADGRAAAARRWRRASSPASGWRSSPPASPSPSSSATRRHWPVWSSFP